MPHFQSLIDWYNARYDTSLTEADINPTHSRAWGTATVDDAVRRVHGFYETAEFKDSPPFHDALAALRTLQIRFDFIAITARDEIIKLTTHNWLEEHFPEIFSEVHFTAFYSLDGKARSKVEVALNKGVEYFIDDNLQNVLEMAGAGIASVVFGNYSWNQSAQLPDNVVRCKNWQEVLEYFDAA